MPLDVGADVDQRRETTSPGRSASGQERGQETLAIASVLMLQQSVGNAAVSTLLRRPSAMAGAPARRRCPCGGVIEDGREECDDCRRKRVASESAVARSLARAGVAKRLAASSDRRQTTGQADESPVQRRAAAGGA